VIIYEYEDNFTLLFLRRGGETTTITIHKIRNFIRNLDPRIFHYIYKLC